MLKQHILTCQSMRREEKQKVVLYIYIIYICKREEEKYNSYILVKYSIYIYIHVGSNTKIMETSAG